jgi:hypothetical protein
VGRTINAMQGKRVRDLIEPLVTTTPEGAPEYVSTAGRTLQREGGVTLVTSETQRVVANVMDGDEAYTVELTSTTEGLRELPLHRWPHGPSVPACLRHGVRRLGASPRVVKSGLERSH